MSEEVAAGKESGKESAKNDKCLQCERCSSVVLKPNTAELVQKEFVIPYMKKKPESASPDDGETLTDFYHVKDMYTFENVGFSRTVGTTKYLLCADCEVGPIGIHDTNSAKDFYVAKDRVKHV